MWSGGGPEKGRVDVTSGEGVCSFALDTQQIDCWQSVGHRVPLSTMISQFFILTPRGDTVVSKDYRGDCPRGAATAATALAILPHHPLSL